MAALHEILPGYSTISNPLDAWGNGDLEKMVPGCVSAVASQAEIGLIAMSRDTPRDVAEREIEQSLRIAESAIKVKNENKKAVCLFSNFSGSFDPRVEQYLRESGIPYLQGTPEALRAIQALENYASFRKHPKYTAGGNPVNSNDLKKWKDRFKQRNQEFSEIEGVNYCAYGIRDRKNQSRQQRKSNSLCIRDRFPVVMKLILPIFHIQRNAEGLGWIHNVQEVISFDQIIASVRSLTRCDIEA